jgi:hypothetical protein
MLSSYKRPLGVDTGSDSYLIVGDVHGHWLPYKKLLKTLGKSAQSKNKILITLGDIVDKGPKSVRCLQATLGQEAAERADATDHHKLWGNHEIMMIETFASLGSSDFKLRMRAWKNSGMTSFLDEAGTTGSDRERTARLIDIIGSDLLGQFSRWKATFETPTMRFVHAGYCPDTGWEHAKRLSPSDLWRKTEEDGLIKHQRHWASIRKPFMDHRFPKGKVIFHGHSTPRVVAMGSVKTQWDILTAFSRLPSHGRICLDGGSGKGMGVVGALVEDNTFQIFYSPCV